MSGCGNTGATLIHWNDWRDPNRTVCGGRHFSATAAAPDSGTRRTSGAVASKLYTDMQTHIGMARFAPVAPFA
jgi:hypothetical protein